jgi:hypothetical protein
VTTEIRAAFVIAAAVASAAPTWTHEDDAVLVSVLRHLAEVMVDDSLRSAGGVACLAIDPGGAPQSVEREMLGSFVDMPFVRRGAECEERPDGAVERATDRPAVLITAGPVEWVGPDEAWVTVRYYRTALQSAVRLYRVVRGESGWVTLGQIIHQSHAACSIMHRVSKGSPPRGGRYRQSREDA